jgi:hypothetical protein
VDGDLWFLEFIPGLMAGYGLRPSDTECGPHLHHSLPKLGPTGVSLTFPSED